MSMDEPVPAGESQPSAVFGRVLLVCLLSGPPLGALIWVLISEAIVRPLRLGGVL